MVQRGAIHQLCSTHPCMHVRPQPHTTHTFYRLPGQKCVVPSRENFNKKKNVIYSLRIRI